MSLRYTQLCRRSGTLNDWLLPLSPTKFTCSPIGKIAIRGRIRSETKLGNVYSPSHDIKIEHTSDNVAKFEYEAKAKVPNHDFRVMWDAGDRDVQLSVVTHRPDKSKDGYFMLMIQPQLPEARADEDKSGKNVILVMDKSGSMRGEKIDQARRAANYVVNKLRGRDHFTLINYDSVVESFRSELTSANKETRADANEYIDSMLAGGSTNINEALSQALHLAADADGPAYVVFMTDGRPTVGERNAMKIADNAKKDLHGVTRLFSLGVGHDVNSRLLDKLASICLGQTLYVRPGQPLDDVVSNLYDRIGSPALIDAKLKLTVDGKEGRTRQLYPSEMYDLFSGDQLVIVGRYRKHGLLKIKLTGDYLGERQEFVFEDELPKRTGSGKNVFVERLWATRRIGQIIDDIDLHGEDKEMVDELILLSKRHGILTPYTAYLAEERTDLNDMRFGRRVAQESLRRLDEESGELAFRQRDFKSSLRGANRANDLADSMQVEMEIGQFGMSSPSSPATRPTRLPSLSKSSALSGGAVALDDTVSQKPKRNAVKRIGAKTFFRRAGRYIDADATKEQIDSAKTIEQFSKKYFDLLSDLNEESKAYLAQETEVLVVIKGRPYLIVPPAKQPN